MGRASTPTQHRTKVGADRYSVLLSFDMRGSRQTVQGQNTSAAPPEVVYLSPADNCDGLLASRLRDGNQTVISPRISLSESLSALHPTFRTTSSILVHIQ